MKSSSCLSDRGITDKIDNIVSPFICRLILYLAPYNVSKCDIRHQWVQVDLFFLLVSNQWRIQDFLQGAPTSGCGNILHEIERIWAKTNLAVLAFLYCGEFVKNPKGEK